MSPRARELRPDQTRGATRASPASVVSARRKLAGCIRWSTPPFLGCKARKYKEGATRWARSICYRQTRAHAWWRPRAGPLRWCRAAIQLSVWRWSVWCFRRNWRCLRC